MERDEGGNTLIKRLSASKHGAQIKIALLHPFKDVSDMHVACPERFRVRLQAAIARAVPFERRKPWRSGSMRLDRAVREQQDRLL